MIRKVTIYGERCSGTNYLENLLTNNFNVEITWIYGWKHFFGHSDLKESDDVLFIGIIRNIFDWINSLYLFRYHLLDEFTKSHKTFLNNEFSSYYLDEKNNICPNKEIIEDRNIKTKEKYKNIFELRHIKNEYLFETMPSLVKNYILITYDNLVDDFKYTMNQLKNCNLEIKQNIEFPLNIYYYKDDPKTIYKKKNNNNISKEIILEKANLQYEKILFPKLF